MLERIVRGLAFMLAALGPMLSPLYGADAPNLIVNGDIEAVSQENPPPGFTLWGAEKYKNPSNVTSETANPHGGERCLRIHHPAGTAGYIVTSPEHPVQIRRGMSYTVRFWARAEQPGHGVFGFDAYESLHPFTGAPSPGQYTVDLGSEWKQYTFAVDEGWDFFASKTKLVLLFFKATADPEQEQTMYLDDIVVTESPSKRQGRLLEREELHAPPVEHRLARGEELVFTVDAAKTLHKAIREVGGISFHRVAGWTGVPYSKTGQYVLPAELEQAVRELHLPMTRFYAVGAEAFSLEDSIDKAAELCGRLGVPTDKVVLELETQGATSILAPDVWARGVKHAQEQGDGFGRWEITNEPSVTSAKAMFPTPDAYVEHFMAVAQAVRAVQPAGQIGLSIDGNGTAWGDYLLKRCAGQYDFIVPHWYCWVDFRKSTFEDAVLRRNSETLDEIARVNALLAAYNPGREVYQYDTEWGLAGEGPNGERPDDLVRNSNIVGTLHRAVRLIYYAREGLLRGASSWEMFTRANSPGFGVLTPDAPRKRFLIYWLYYLFNRHLGESVLDLQGTAPYYEWNGGGGKLSMPQTPVLASLSADGKSLYLVIVNGSWSKPAPCRIALRDFPAARVQAVALSQESQDASSLLEKEDDAVSDLQTHLGSDSLTCTIPAHSAVFVTVSARAGQPR